MANLHTTVWLQVKPEFFGSGQLPRSLAVVNMTKNPPRISRGNAAIVVKVNLSIPAEVFAKFAPEVTIDVPATLVHEFPVEAQALDPSADYPDDGANDFEEDTDDRTDA